jgi:hypothetical protein
MKIKVERMKTHIEWMQSNLNVRRFSSRKLIPAYITKRAASLATLYKPVIAPKTNAKAMTNAGCNFTFSNNTKLTAITNNV